MRFLAFRKIRETSKYTLYRADNKSLIWIICSTSIIFLVASVIITLIFGVDHVVDLETKLSKVTLFMFFLGVIMNFTFLVLYSISNFSLSKKMLLARSKKKKVEEIAEGGFIFPKWEFKIYK